VVEIIALLDTSCLLNSAVCKKKCARFWNRSGAAAHDARRAAHPGEVRSTKRCARSLGAESHFPLRQDGPAQHVLPGGQRQGTCVRGDIVAFAHSCSLPACVTPRLQRSHPLQICAKTYPCRLPSWSRFPSSSLWWHPIPQRSSTRSLRVVRRAMSCGVWSRFPPPSFLLNPPPPSLPLPPTPHRPRSQRPRACQGRQGHQGRVYAGPCPRRGGGARGARW
jgi:hypothetical protein